MEVVAGTSKINSNWLEEFMKKRLVGHSRWLYEVEGRTLAVDQIAREALTVKHRVLYVIQVSPSRTQSYATIVTVYLTGLNHPLVRVMSGTMQIRKL